MTLLIVLLAVLAGVWLWKRGRSRHLQQGAAPRTPTRALPMVRCTRCGTHIPGNEAVVGRRGSYCSTVHRHESEGQ